MHRVKEETRCQNLCTYILKAFFKSSSLFLYLSYAPTVSVLHSKYRSQISNPSFFQNAIKEPQRYFHFMQITKKRMYTTCYGWRTQDVLVPLHLHLPLRILLLLLPLCSVEKKLSNRFWKVKEKVEKSVLFGFYFQELKHVKNCIENWREMHTVLSDRD